MSASDVRASVDEVYENATIAFRLTGEAEDLHSRISRAILELEDDLERGLMAAFLLCKALQECDFTFRVRFHARLHEPIGECAVRLMRPVTEWEKAMVELLRLHLDGDRTALHQHMCEMRAENRLRMPSLIDMISFFAIVATRFYRSPLRSVV